MQLSQFMSQSVEDRVRVRDQLYANIEFIDSFAEENPFCLSDEELAIIRSWKHSVRGSFYLFRHLKKHSIFLSSSSPPRTYGVLSISDRLKDLFPYLPVMVEAALLPFKGRIIYDGYLSGYRVHFGGGIRRGFKESYDQAKASFGIITSLPFIQTEQERTDEDRLKYYLKNERNREYHWEEIQDLIRKDPKLRIVFHQEMGKSYARTYARRLRDVGIGDAWFGILEGLIVASGKTKQDVEKNLEDIVPSNQLQYVYLYRLKSKGKS